MSLYDDIDISEPNKESGTKGKNKNINKFRDLTDFISRIDWRMVRVDKVIAWFDSCEEIPSATTATQSNIDSFSMLVRFYTFVERRT